MNKIIFYSIICILAVSCTKRDTVGAPDFEVSASKSTYKLGDSVIFNFKGSPQNIVFWPGTDGRKYEYRNRTVATGNKLLVRFNTWQQFVVRNNNLIALVSNNFNGIYDVPNVQAATWTDVTNRFVLSTGVDQTPSGTVDLSEFTEGNKSVTFAFRFVTENYPSQTRWVIRSWFADQQWPDGSITSLATVRNAGWKAVSFVNPATNWLIQQDQLLSQATANNADEDWVFSKSFNITSVVPDKGIAVKNITTNLTRYVAATDLYTKPGTYKVVFEASNASYQSEIQRAAKEITITIEP